MEAIEDLIPRVLVSTVVAIAKTMVLLMHEIAELQFKELTEANVMKAAMRRRSAHRVQHGIENHMNRVTSDEEINHQIRVKNEVLNRMHCMT